MGFDLSSNPSCVVTNYQLQEYADVDDHGDNDNDDNATKNNVNNDHNHYQQ